MGAIQNIHILAPEGALPGSVLLVAQAVVRAGLASPPYLAGDALYRDPDDPPGAAFPVAPEHVTYLREQYAAFSTLDAALALPERPAGGLVEMEIDASHIRREPQHFRTEPASLGFYRVPQGHELVIGLGEDLSEFMEDWKPTPPAFAGRVVEWVWLEGKNAPLLEDFLDSTLHRTLLSVWPGARIFEECNP